MIATLLWMILEKSAGLHDEYIHNHPLYTNVFVVVAIAVYVMALRDKKKNHYHGVMSWTQGFLSGVIISLVVAILSPATNYIAFTFITPDFFENAINYATSRGTLTREAAAMLFNLKSYIIQGAFGAISMGVVTSAVVAYFIQTRKIVNK